MKKIIGILAVLVIVLVAVIVEQRETIGWLKWRVDFQEKFLDSQSTTKAYLHDTIWEYDGWDYFQMGRGDKTVFDRFKRGDESLACAIIVKDGDGEVMMTSTRRYKKVVVPPFLLHEFVR